MKVKGGAYDFYYINKADFDPKVHIEYVEGEPSKAPSKTAKKA